MDAGAIAPVHVEEMPSDLLRVNLDTPKIRRALTAISARASSGNRFDVPQESARLSRPNHTANQVRLSAAVYKIKPSHGKLSRAMAEYYSLRSHSHRCQRDKSL
jgi:hypothetical protein